MTRFLLGRVAQTLLSMLVVISIVFVLARMSGNPIDLLLDANATDQERAILMRHHGLDQRKDLGDARIRPRVHQVGVPI